MMRSALLILLVFSCRSIAAPQDEPKPKAPVKQVTIRFDGVYRTTAQEAGFYYYLRFYPDGTVLTLSSGKELEETTRTFGQSNHTSKGTWMLAGTRLMFTGTSSAGKVDYDGTVEPDLMTIRYYSHINKRRGEEGFTFYKAILSND